MRVIYYIDFDNDGLFTGMDDISAYVKDATWAIGMHKPNQLTGDETVLDFVLENKDGRFSPENSASPYYGKLLPNRRVKIVAEVYGVEYPLYLGLFEKIEVAPFIRKTAQLRCVGAKQYIQEQFVKIPLMEDVRSDEVIAAILEKLHLPPAQGDSWILGAVGFSELGETTMLNDLSLSIELDTGLSSFPYVADNWDKNFQGNQYVNKDWSTGFKGYEAILDVVKAERGRFFFDREGKAVFWARDRFPLNDNVVGSYESKDFVNGKYSYGANLFNEIHCYAYPRSIDPNPNPIWSLDESMIVPRGEDTELDVSWADDDSGASISVIEPSVSSFSANGDVSYYVDYMARGAKISFHNGDSRRRRVNTMVINGRRLRAYNKVDRSAIDGTSSSLYGRKEFRIDSKLISDPDFARNVATYELSRFSQPRGEFEWVEMLVKDDAKALEVMTRGMGDRIRIADASLGHDKEYFIIGEKHQRSLNLGYHVTWYLEEADMSQFWVIGVDGYSELGETSYLGL